jgi:Uma2 family endonuclease
MVVCGDPQYADDQKDTLLNPVLIGEVLSPSTRDYERGMKAEHYRRLPSLNEYLIVAQQRPYVEQWTRQPENRWLVTEFFNSTEIIQLESFGCTLPLAEIYHQIDFTAGS